MTATIQEITEAALLLPEPQRAELADTLLGSLDDSTADPYQIESAWTQEIRTRLDDIVTGRVNTIPWDEVKALLAADRSARQR